MKRTKKRGNRKNKSKRKMRGGNPKNIIPRIVHQIWFGGPILSWKQFLFDQVREVCERNGYKYRLWVNEDRTKANFPITYAYQQTSIELGKKRGQNSMAQVADLARLEILFNHGGIYLDSNFIIKDDFLIELQKMNFCAGKTFIGANEDECGLKCENKDGEKYLSNSFFSSIRRHPVLMRLLDADEDGLLENVDFTSPEFNKTTGPYYLRKGIKDPDEDKVGLFETEQIYPFPMSGSDRPGNPNICITNSAQPNTIQVGPTKYLYRNCSDLIPETALASYMVGLGGSWSL